MQLKKRPTRLPITCTCGVRLSVIPRLQGTQIECPVCHAALHVPESPKDDVITGVREVESDLSDTAMSPVTDSRIVAADHADNGFRSDSVPGDPLSAEEAFESLRGDARESIFRQIPITSMDCDLFGYPLTDPAASLNCVLDGKTPKTIKELRTESRYHATERHIERLQAEGKVRAVWMSSNEVGYIIDPDWVKQIQEVRPPHLGVANSELTPIESRSKGSGEISSQQQADAVGATDIFGRRIGHGAAHMNKFLSENIPKTIRTLTAESGYMNTAHHVRKLVAEKKVQAVKMDTGETGYVINPEWLCSVRVDASDNQPMRQVHSPNSIAMFRSDTQVTRNPALRDSKELQSSPPAELETDAQKSGRRTDLNRGDVKQRPVRGTFVESSAGDRSASNSTISANRPAGSGLLTPVQQKVFDVITKWYSEKGVSPTIPEIRQATQLSNYGAINEVDALVRKGMIEFDRSEARGIRVIPESERDLIRDIPDAEYRQEDKSDSFSRATTREEIMSVLETSAPALPKTVRETPEWLRQLMQSQVLERQCQTAGRRVPPREQIHDLLFLLADQKFLLHRDTLCQAMNLPPLRFPGFVSVFMRLLNVDSVPVLTQDPSGDTVRLNLELLCRQFGINPA
jgi:hypothetical protein